MPENGAVPSTINVLRQFHRSHDIHTGTWREYGNGIDSYDYTFRYVLGPYNALEGRQTTFVDLMSGKPEPVIVDLMAPPDSLHDLFSKTKPARAFGVAVSTEELDRPSLPVLSPDIQLNHLLGDITKAQTWIDLKEMLGDRKADLIIERGAGALKRGIPIHEGVYATLLNRAWELLSDQGGKLVVEGPKLAELQEKKVHITRWIKLLESQQIDVAFDNGKRGDFASSTKLKITRHPNSPSRLPLLNGNH